MGAQNLLFLVFVVPTLLARSQAAMIIGVQLRNVYISTLIPQHCEKHKGYHPRKTIQATGTNGPVDNYYKYE
ncbi:MAG: hypothetical protein ACI93R_002005 [Flavobacteriales bacterium]|jgi:hypothetical protein